MQKQQAVVWLAGLAVVLFGFLAVAFSVGVAAVTRLPRLQWEAIIAIGQLCLGLYILPITVFGFLFAFQELQRNLATPKLALYVDLFPGLTDRMSIEPGKQSHPLRLVLKNDGNAVAVWYILNFQIPSDLDDSPKFQPIVGTGNKDYWKPAYYKDTRDNVYTLRSLGDEAAYPDYPLALCDVHVTPDPHDQPKTYEIPYTIAGSVGRVEGVIKLRVQPSSAGPA